MEIVESKIYCPLMKRKIDTGYCWELCNIATDAILLPGDTISDWKKAWATCDKCPNSFDNDDEPDED